MTSSLLFLLVFLIIFVSPTSYAYDGTSARIVVLIADKYFSFVLSTWKVMVAVLGTTFVLVIFIDVVCFVRFVEFRSIRNNTC